METKVLTVLVFLLLIQSLIQNDFFSFLWQDESLKQLQVVHQPWILPSDTESEGVEAEQEKRE